MLSANDAIQSAVQHHQAGRLAEAERIYLQILAGQPSHSDALHLLGVLKGQRGEADAGIELIRRAVQANPGSADAFLNLGRLLADLGRLEESAAAYRWVVQLKPNDARAHMSLGSVLKTQGRLGEAIAAYTESARIEPGSAALQFHLGDLLREAGRKNEALAAYQRAAQNRPDFAEAHNNIGNLLRERGMVAEAIAAYHTAARLKPDWAQAHFNLGQLHREAGRFEEAITFYRKSVSAQPDYAEAHANLAATLADLQRFDEAMQSHARAAALAPDAVFTHESLGMILLQEGNGTAAAESFRRAVAISADCATSWNGLGLALRSTGRFDEAAESFTHALAIRPDLTVALTSLASLHRSTSDNAEIDRLKSMLGRADLAPEDRISAGFALGKLLDEADRFDEAFAQYAQSNALVKQLKAAAGEMFNPDAFSRQVDQLIGTFTPEYFARVQSWGDRSELPGFIVGMPRSGTTLVEQIAASHPDVFGAGELRDMDRIASSLKWPWEIGSIRQAATAHLQKLPVLGGGASRVIDKMPANVLHLGLIATLFSSARVIFCRRDARDNCLSCFFQYFTNGNLFSYDLEHCARYYAETERLMNHWRGALPLRMLDVEYEELVADLEQQSRRLIEFLGLAWDPACLEFHRTERTVLTASVWQVRQPIYTRSVGRWRHYGSYLGSLAP